MNAFLDGIIEKEQYLAKKEEWLKVESCGQLAEGEKPKTRNPDPLVKWSSRLQAARTWVREHSLQSSIQLYK